MFCATSTRNSFMKWVIFWWASLSKNSVLSILAKSEREMVRLNGWSSISSLKSSFDLWASPYGDFWSLKSHDMVMHAAWARSSYPSHYWLEVACSSFFKRLMILPLRIFPLWILLNTDEIVAVLNLNQEEEEFSIWLNEWGTVKRYWKEMIKNWSYMILKPLGRQWNDNWEAFWDMIA